MRSAFVATQIEDEPIKWMFPSIMAAVKSLIFLKSNSHAKMAPDNLGLPYDQAEQRLATTALSWIRSIYPALPASLRYVGPYQEALGRLSGKARPSLFIQCSNRFWIGQGALG